MTVRSCSNIERENIYVKKQLYRVLTLPWCYTLSNSTPHPANIIIANLPPLQLWANFITTCKSTVKNWGVQHNLTWLQSCYITTAVVEIPREETWFASQAICFYTPDGVIFCGHVGYMLIWSYRTFIPSGLWCVQFIPIGIQRNIFANLQVYGTLCGRFKTDWKIVILVYLLYLSIMYICISLYKR